MRNVILFGGGSLALETINYFNDINSNSNCKIVGIIDEYNSNIKPLEKCNNSKLDFYKNIDDIQIADYEFIICVMEPKVRSRIYRELKEKNAKFMSIIHPSAYISKSAIIGEAVIVCPHSYIGPNSKVADNAVINIYASLGHDSYLGESSFMGPRSSMLGKSRCEEEVFLGSQSTISVGVSVGKKSKISYNSTLTKNCPEGSLAHGIPAKFKEMFK